MSQVAALVLLVGIVAADGTDAPAVGFLVAADAAGLGELVGVAALYRGSAVRRMSVVAPVAAIARRSRWWRG